MEKKKRRYYPDSEKLFIIDEQLKTGASFSELGKKYSIFPSVISQWFIKFGVERPKSIEQSMAKTGMDETTYETIKALREELRTVRKELAEEKLRSVAYDKMIDVAEEMFHIEIRKKAGTKQSKR